MTRIAMIAAMGNDRVIGADNRLAWHLPPDLKRFKQLTMNKPMIMGRKTFESLPGLLPGRLHIVISRHKGVDQDRVIFVSSVREAIEAASKQPSEEIMVIGGAQIYTLFQPLADILYLTEVEIHVADGDAFFPELDENWRVMTQDEPLTDEKSGLIYSYKTYVRG